MRIADKIRLNVFVNSGCRDFSALSWLTELSIYMHETFHRAFGNGDHVFINTCIRV